MKASFSCWRCRSSASSISAGCSDIWHSSANAKHAYSYLLYLLFAVELNDVAAFTSGKLFGRHPLRSNISPKKTREGAIGALGVSLALPWVSHGRFRISGHGIAS